MNRATVQTGDANSVMDAYMARMQANTAESEAMKAQTASDAAQNAANAAEARPYETAAEMARDAAMEAQTMAESARDDAVADADVELKIDDKTKIVGDTSITVDRKSSTSADGRTHTGLLSGMDIMTTGTRDVNGHVALDEQGEQVANAGTVAMPSIGFTYDSEDDDARLTLVHSYLGEAKEKQFIRADTTPSSVIGSPFGAAPSETGLAPNADSSDTIRDGSVTVTPQAANSALGLSGDAVLTAAVVGIPRVAGGEFKAFDDLDGTQPLLYFVESNVTDNSVGTDDDGIDQARIFLERRVIGNEITYDVVHVREVTIDKAMEFQHLHYGLWNGLTGRDGNTVSELGVAFVTAIASGDGMTAMSDLPNVSTLTYKSNWVGNVQRADTRGRGDIMRQSGTASIMADFEDNELDVTLTGLAMLVGEIDGNMFSGDSVTLMDTAADAEGIQANYGLDGSGKFSGSFEGAFFGPRAKEAGGVFGFDSEDNEAGAFRGSFGGARD